MEEKSNQHIGSFLLEAFKETNQHLRSTENKSLAITGTYLAFFTSFVANQIMRRREDGAELVVHVVALALSALVIVLQKWYRIWKVDYMGRCQRLVEKIIDLSGSPVGHGSGIMFQKLLPSWMLEPPKGWHVDRVLQIITVFAAMVIAASLTWLLWNRALYYWVVAVPLLLLLGVVGFAKMNDEPGSA